MNLRFRSVARGRRRLSPVAAAHTCLVAALLLSGHGAAALQAECLPLPRPAVTGVILNRLEVLRSQGAVWAAGERIRARSALPDFYRRREWQPAWLGGEGPTSCALALVDRLLRASEDGLAAEDYHASALARLLTEVRVGGATADDLADLEFLLTDAFLVFGSHLSRGRVDPETLEAEWLANRRELDMAAVLEEALAADRVDEALVALRPPQPGYGRLLESLAVLRARASSGGWGSVPAGPTLRPGDTDPRVSALRTRLRAGGDLAPADDVGGETFDAALGSAVAAFQLRHGLSPDSAVGVRTLAALNVPVEQRIAQVVVNLERWRWLPDDLGRRHIRVNIADYRVEVRNGGAVDLEMRAVVGRDYRQTPSFSGRMTYLVLAPYWHVPPGIAMNDKLPELKRDPGVLARQGMVLLSQSTNQVVDPATVDFAALSGAEFNRRYRLRQEPGPLNALGRVKFMFPNRHSVYMHDTPSRELFARTERAFSSGCIRLERPMDLAEYLLAGDPNWPRERIIAVAEGGRETTVPLAEAVPVHLLYWTAFVDEAGRIHFRPDIYQRDPRVQGALDEDPPGL